MGNELEVCNFKCVRFNAQLKIVCTYKIISLDTDRIYLSESIIYICADNSTSKYLNIL